MNPSIRLGSLFGITIRVHWLFLVMAVFFLQQIPAVWFVLLFGSVFLHELGHSLVAQAFGIRVLDITFWPLGGMARMSQIPESPKVEGLVAIAGPAVNFVLVGLALPFWIGAGAVIGTNLWFFLAMNLMLGVFNLIPAFPMDGGRILRALLGLRFDWLRATELAVRVGRVAAVVMFVVGVAQGFWMVALISLFVWWAGMQELIATRLRHARQGYGPFADLGGLAGAFGADPRGPAGPRGPGEPGRSGPLRDWTERWAGPASGAAPRPQPAPSWGGGPEDGPSGPRRPEAPGSISIGPRGISDEDVERLERFRGRIGRGH